MICERSLKLFVWRADRHPSVYEAGTPATLGGLVMSLHVDMTVGATRTLPCTFTQEVDDGPRHSTLEKSRGGQYLADTVFRATCDYTAANCELADGTIRHAVG